MKATEGGRRDMFLKATRLSRLQEVDTVISFSRRQGYQGYRRGAQGYVSQGYKSIQGRTGSSGYYNRRTCMGQEAHSSSSL